MKAFAKSLLHLQSKENYYHFKILTKSLLLIFLSISQQTTAYEENTRRAKKEEEEKLLKKKEKIPNQIKWIEKVIKRVL